MNQSEMILLSLIGCALNKNYTPEVNLLKIEWGKVKDIAARQDLLAIAFDGYQRLYDHLGPSAVPRDVLMNWIGRVFYQEARYNAQLSSAAKLAKYYDDNHVNTYVLKGLSLAQLYPIPSHRYSCDMDFYLVYSNEEMIQCAYDYGNTLLENKGVQVLKDYYKHSEFDFGSVHFENHRYCCGVKRGDRTKQLERTLIEILSVQKGTPIADTKLLSPSPTFLGIQFLDHACGHFLYEKMSLKNICDWAMFRRRYADVLDWTEFDSICTRFCLKDYAECVGRLGDFILGVTTYADLSSLDRRVLDDTLKEVNLPRDKMKQRFWKAFNVLNSSWKFRYFNSDSMIKELAHSFFSYLSDSDIDL